MDTTDPRRSSAPFGTIETGWISAFAFCSGFASLLYESLWMRGLELAFGGTREAVTLILAVFMAGMALGSRAAASPRLKHPRLGTYALIEGGIGLAAILSHLLLRGFPSWYGVFAAAHPMQPLAAGILKAALAALILFPATFLVGMTTPVLIAILSSNRKGLETNFSLLYRINTFGGVLGTLVGTFLFLPLWGVPGTFFAGVALNLAIAFSARAMVQRREKTETSGGIAVPEPSFGRQPLGPLAAAAALGAASFLLESVWIRSYVLITGSSIYSFNVTVAAFLTGLVAGTALYEKTWRRLPSGGRWLPPLLGTLGVLILLQAWALGFLPDVFYQFLRIAKPSFVPYQAFGYLLSFTSMLPVTLGFGYAFPALIGWLKESRGDDRQLTGRLYAWNTWGAVAGTLAAGYWLMPLLGLQGLYPLVAAVPLCLAAALLPAGRILRTILAVFILAAGIWGSAAFRPWDPLVMSCGIYHHGLRWGTYGQGAISLRKLLAANRRLLWYKEGLDAVVDVTDSGGILGLGINGKVDASTGLDASTQKMVAHLPLMLHPDPKEVFVVGWGSGSTCGSALLHPEVGSLDCAEIEEAVYEARPFFKSVNFDSDKDPRFTIHRADARSFLLSTPRRFDVILSEPSNPWITGVSNLFTEEYYRIALGRLKPGGLFCQWIHYYTLRPEDVQTLVSTFLRVFPNASLWVPSRSKQMSLGDVLLLGSAEPVVLDEARMASRFRGKKVSADLSFCGLDRPLNFWSLRMDSQSGLSAFVQDAPSNQDIHPRVEFSAPKSNYRTVADDIRITTLLHQELTRSREKDPYPSLGRSWKETEKRAIIRNWLNMGILERSGTAAERLYAGGDRSADLLADLGRVEINRKRPEKALPYLKEAVRRAPKDPYVRKYLARALFHLSGAVADRDASGALKLLKQSLLLLPGQIDALELQKKLSRNPQPQPPPKM